MVLVPVLLASAATATALALSASLLSHACADVPSRGRWVSKEDVDAMRLKVPMPGLGKDHVKVWAEKNALMIEGEGDKDTEYDDDLKAPPRYSHRVELPAKNAFKMDQIRAEMKDGVLKVTVPKSKAEERKDAFQVKVE